MECDVRTPNLRLEPRVCVSFIVQIRDNLTCEVCCSHTRRLLQTAVSRERTDYNNRSICCSFTSSDVPDIF